MWTNTMIELCKQMAKDGYSGKQIAETLGTKTRNAVIGKMSRMGIQLGNPLITKNGKSFKLPEESRNKRMISFARKIIDIKYANLPVEKIKIRRDNGVEFKDLKNNQCRWPFGEKNYYFCGKTKTHGSSYCADHEYVSRYHPKETR